MTFYKCHKIEELLAIGDRISILRDGHYITTLPREESSKEKVVTAMVGRKLDQYYTKSQHTAGKEILRVENLSGQGFKNVSFSLKQGEILGFFGLIGAGRTELMETIFGYRPLNDGKIYFNGELLKIKNPSNLIEKGVGFIPEDRKLKGLSLIHSIKMNLEFLNLDIVKGSSGLFVSTKKERDFAQKAVDALKIKTSSLDKLVSLLSGGNQQKIVIAKWLPRNPKVLILDEPTRGIDVLTKAEIYKLIDELALNGIGIIMVSSELPEILQMSDRIAVMSDGNLVDILINGPDVNQEKIMHLSTSISTSKESLLKQNQNLIKR
ncbi:MAG: sugar ABC transporter ATP-binding protein [Candidatus Parvarchaeota archaeon]|nr:sugar ABC transporter ATP-binding protein [Candidatus Jingweiarchaeum tengchongense]